MNTQVELTIKHEDTEYLIKYDFRVDYDYEQIFVYSRIKGKRKWNKAYEFDYDYKWRELDLNARSEYMINKYNEIIPNFNYAIRVLREKFVEQIEKLIYDKPIKISANCF